MKSISLLRKPKLRARSAHCLVTLSHLSCREAGFFFGEVEALGDLEREL